MRPSPKTTTPPRYPFPQRPPWPPEHGAWFALLINFLLGAFLAPVHNIAAEVVLGLTIFAFFLARHPLLLIAMRWKYKALQPGYFFRERLVWTAAWGGVGGVGSLFLVTVFHAEFLLPVAAVWVLSVIFETVAVYTRTQKTAFSEGWGMAALTLCVVAAMSMGGDAILPQAWLIWFLTLAYHLQAVFYVRMRIRALSGKNSFSTWRDKLLFARANGGMLILNWGVLGVAIQTSLMPPYILIAFVPMTLRALWGITRLGRPTAVRRLGYSEVAFSLVFSALLFYTLRG